MLNKFWNWYENNFKANLYIATFLFLLQLLHLYWLFTDVVLLKLTGVSFFALESVWGQMSIFFDYTEIPAIVATTFVYVHYLKQRSSYKYWIYLIMLNLQWIHILWITDEYVLEHFMTHPDAVLFPEIVAWAAILIDFLELPVIYDTVKHSIKNILQKENSG